MNPKINPALVVFIHKDDRKNSGWVEGVFDGHGFNAKIYDMASIHGIENGRVSKLSVLKLAPRDPNSNYLKQCCFNYDRGLDFGRMKSPLIQNLIKWAEQIPLADVPFAAGSMQHFVTPKSEARALRRVVKKRSKKSKSMKL